jgi:hypothetical protein
VVHPALHDTERLKCGDDFGDRERGGVGVDQRCEHRLWVDRPCHEITLSDVCTRCSMVQDSFRSFPGRPISACRTALSVKAHAKGSVRAAPLERDLQSYGPVKVATGTEITGPVSAVTRSLPTGGQQCPVDAERSAW